MSVTFVLSSVTYAMKAQDLLKRESIYSSIIRSPDVRAIKGCGYGIKIQSNCESYAKKILQLNGVSILGCIYD
ncbi:MAG: DUF3343 domain-containing protein [Eubacteriales bacterium]|nr:DUF3343 domain-containing protein [Eubacteriales bacterium]MDD4421825.1 DUF3343 domain-containing protein [Eubacteriales bacterium]HBR31780.1 DUF3343 domain-containing protein [Clostridiales bacterium]